MLCVNVSELVYMCVCERVCIGEHACTVEVTREHPCRSTSSISVCLCFECVRARAFLCLGGCLGHSLHREASQLFPMVLNGSSTPARLGVGSEGQLVGEGQVFIIRGWGHPLEDQIWGALLQASHSLTSFSEGGKRLVSFSSLPLTYLPSNKIVNSCFS